MNTSTAASAALAQTLLSDPSFAEQRTGPFSGTAQLQQIANVGQTLYRGSVVALDMGCRVELLAGCIRSDLEP